MWKSIIFLLFILNLINSKLIITDFDYYYVKDGVVLRCLYDNGRLEKNDKVQFFVNKTLLYSSNELNDKVFQKLDGAQIDIANSNSTHLVLKNVYKKMNGMFGCLVKSIKTIETSKAERTFLFDFPSTGYMKQKYLIRPSYFEKETNSQNYKNFNSQINLKNENVLRNLNNYEYKDTFNSKNYGNLFPSKKNEIEISLRNPENKLNLNNYKNYRNYEIENNKKEINSEKNLRNSKNIDYYELNLNDNENDSSKLIKPYKNNKLINQQINNENLSSLKNNQRYTDQEHHMYDVEHPLTNQQEKEASGEIVKKEYLSYWTRVNLVKLYSEIAAIKRRIGIIPKTSIYSQRLDP